MIITDILAGERLDKAMAELLPEASLRHRRRLIETGAATLDGRAVRPGVKVRAGQVIEIQAQAEVMIPDGVRLLERVGPYAAVVKPAGVHSAAVRGGSGASGVNIEAALPVLFPGEQAALLNRLDVATSGFVLVAFSASAVERFREMEAAGQVRKEYLARVEGRMEQPMVVRHALDMANRQKVRAMEERDPDPARHTHVEPLQADEQSTLVRAIISRGARHQIRVHLAHLGHAIVGDPLYGSGAGDTLFLHHRAIEFEGFAAQLEPDWQ